MKDLVGTGIRKKFIALGLLLFTSIKCEGNTSENLVRLLFPRYHIPFI